MRRFAWVLAIWSGVVTAQDWQVLSGDAIRAALDARRVDYDSGAWQEFRASGRTLYNAGADSWGYWRFQGDFYCSQWPPSDLWACYSVEVAGDALGFIGASGEVTAAMFAD
ncbi:MAG: hypothetical protein ACI8R4_002808 [Paracoccaceae bacterium]|jgi:hypothetical protein